jgi:hypothetical protein
MRDQARQKFCSKKREKMTQTRSDVERERCEQRFKHEALLKEWGVTEQELREWWAQDEVSDGDAAYEERCEEEECRKLIGKFARESVRRIRSKIGDIRDRYETIVMELLAARYMQTDGKRYSLGTVLRGKCETDTALKEFLPKFAKWIGEYVSDCIREHSFGFTSLYRQIVPTHTWTLCDHNVGRELLTALAEEYVRDRAGLMRFLFTVFKHWQKLFAPCSPWRVRLLAQQITGTSNEVAAAMERIGAVPRNSQSLGDRVRQYRSRDRKEALKRQGL